MNATKWIKRGAWTLGALCGARALLAVGLEPAAGWIAGARGVDLGWESHTLSLFGGEFELSGLRLAKADAPDAPAFLQLGHLRADVSLRALLGGELVVDALEVDGLHAAAGVAQDGTLRLAGDFDPAALAAAPAAEPASLPLSRAPLVLRDVRVRHAKLVWSDAELGGAPTIVDIEAEGADLFAPGAEGSFELRCASSGLLDSLRVRLGTQVVVDDVETSTRVSVGMEMAGLRSRRLAELLRRHGVVARGERVDADAELVLDLRGRNDDAQQVDAALTLAEANVAGDGVAALTLERLHIALELAAGQLLVREVRIVAPRLRAELAQDGVPLFAGVGWDASQVRSTTSVPAPTTTTGDRRPAPRVAVAELSLERGRVELVDRRAAPAQTIGLDVRSVVLEDFDSQAGAQSPEMSLQASAAVDGAAKELQASAKLRFGAEVASAAVLLAGDDVSLAAWRGVLEPLGLKPTPRPADLRAEFGCTLARDAQGAWTGSAEIKQLSAVDGVQRLAAGTTKVEGLRFDAQRLSLANLQVEGGIVEVRRDAQGDMVLPLLTIAATKPAISPVAQAAGGGASAPPAATTPWALEVARAAFGVEMVQFVDEAVVPATTLALRGASLELSDLRTGGAQQAARLKGGFEAPGLVRRAALEGAATLSADFARTTLEARLSADGVDLRKLQAYLAPLGVEALAADGSAKATVRADVSVDATGLRLDASLAQLSWSDAGRNLARLDRLAVQGLSVDGDGVEVAEASLSGARLAVARDAEGRFLFAGVRYDPSRTAAAPADAAGPATAQLPRIAIEKLAVSDTAIELSDAVVQPALSAVFALEGELSGFATRGDTQARLAAKCTFAPVFATASVDGLVRLAPNRLDGQFQFALEHLDARQLSRWLPQGIRGESDDLRAGLRAGLVVEWSRDPALAFELAEASLVQAPDDPARRREWLSIGEIALEAPKLDPRDLRIAAIAAKGVRVDAERAADGALRACGFLLAPSPSTTPRKPLVVKLVDVPRIELGKLRLQLERLRWADARLGGRALETSFAVQLDRPWIASSPFEAEATPLSLSAVGVVPRLVRQWNAQLQLGLVQPEPSLFAKFAASGIDGASLAEFAPGLQPLVDASTLVDASFETGVRASLRFPRRGLYEADLSAGFAAELALLSTRLSAGDTTLLGVDGLRLEAKRVVPHTGDVHLSRIEVDTPRLRVVRRGARLEVAGIAFDLGAAERPPAQDAPQPEAASSAAGVVEAAAPAPAERKPELRLDELAVHGLQFDLRDEGVEPPTSVPLRDLDLSLRRFTTRMFDEPRSVRFSMQLGSGKAPLPRRHGVGNALLGMVKALQADARSAVELEERELLEEVALSGRLQLVPEPRAQLQFNVVALELLGLRGSAAEHGVSIGDGLFDLGVRARLQGDRLSIDSTAVFTDLSLAEPKAGPVETYLSIPMPLDAALFLLKNSDGEIRIPVGIDVSTKGVSGAEAALAGGKAAAAVVARAVAGAPLRVLSTFTDLFADAKALPKTDASRLRFVPGTTSIDARSRAEFEPLLRRLQADDKLVAVVQHRLSPADVERLELLANPSRADVEELQSRLRQRRRELLREHAGIAARARAGQGSWRGGAVEELRARWREVEAELGRVESALDETGELLQPGADRYRGKRTRSAGLELARRRLDEVEALLSSARPGVQVELRPPQWQAADDDSGGTALVVLRKR